MKFQKPRPLGPVCPKSNLVCVGTKRKDIDPDKLTEALNELVEETGILMCFEDYFNEGNNL
jgi:hypothetical protein